MWECDKFPAILKGSITFIHSVYSLTANVYLSAIYMNLLISIKSYLLSHVKSIYFDLLLYRSYLFAVTVDWNFIDLDDSIWYVYKHSKSFKIERFRIKHQPAE